MRRLLHTLAHRLGWNVGTSDAYWDGDTLMMSFVCSGCGERADIHEIGRRGVRR